VLFVKNALEVEGEVYPPQRGALGRGYRASKCPHCAVTQMTSRAAISRPLARFKGPILPREGGGMGKDKGGEGRVEEVRGAYEKRGERMQRERGKDKGEERGGRGRALQSVPPVSNLPLHHCC